MPEQSELPRQKGKQVITILTSDEICRDILGNFRS